MTQKLTTKICTVCKKSKSVDAFNKRNACKDGKSYRCKVCDRLARLKWERDNPEKSRRSARERHLKHKYGISIADYTRMFAKQNERCAICHVKENNTKQQRTADTLNFAVDHCHVTGEIRGLLCNKCNSALGHFKDNPDTIRAAAAYLEKHKEGG